MNINIDFSVDVEVPSQEVIDDQNSHNLSDDNTIEALEMFENTSDEDDNEEAVEEEAEEEVDECS